SVSKNRRLIAASKASSSSRSRSRKTLRAEGPDAPTGFAPALFRGRAASVRIAIDCHHLISRRKIHVIVFPEPSVSAAMADGIQAIRWWKGAPPGIFDVVE